MFDFEYLLERACLFESAAYYINYGDWIFGPKALKLIKKNPIFNNIFLNHKRSVGVKAFKSKNIIYGDLSYEFPQFYRGIGSKDPETGKHLIKWVGTHEQYNTVKNQR